MKSEGMGFFGREVVRLFNIDLESLGKPTIEDVQYAMLLDGAAWWFPVKGKNKTREYEQAMNTAKAKKRGLWNTPEGVDPIEPKEFRKLSKRSKKISEEIRHLCKSDEEAKKVLAVDITQICSEIDYDEALKKVQDGFKGSCSIMMQTCEDVCFKVNDIYVECSKIRKEKQ